MINVEKGRLMKPQWAGASATASSNSASAAHVLMLDRDHAWYSEAAPADGPVPDQTLTITLPKPVAIDLLVLDRHNLSGAARVRWQLYSAGVEVYDSGQVAVGHPIPWGVFKAGVHALGQSWDEQLPVRVAEQFVEPLVFADRIDISLSDPDNRDGWFCIERIPFGLSTSFENNFSWGAQLEWVDNTRLTAVEGGGVDIDEGDVFRRLTLPFEFLSAADRAFIHAELAASKAQPWFVMAYPSRQGSSTEQLAYMFTGIRENNVTTGRTNVRFGRAEFTFREA